MKGRLYPWPTFREPLAVTPQVTLNGRGVPVRAVDLSHRRIDLGQVSEPWQTLEIDFAVTPPADTPPYADARAHALMSCVPTAQRISVPLRANNAGWRGLVRVVREEVYGSGSLEAVVTASVQLGDEEPVPARLIGRSEPWSITFDSQHGPPGRSRSPMKAVWADFSAPGDGAPAELSRVAQALSYCDIVPSEPVLYLNKEIAGLQALLDDSKATSRRRQVQQHLGAAIALDAVLALVDAAIHAVQPPELGDEAPGASLAQPLTATLRAIVDESEDFADLAELLRRISIAKGAGDTDELSRIRALVRSTAQTLVGSRRSAEALIKGVSDD